MKYKIINKIVLGFCGLSLLTLPGCYSVKKSVQASYPNSQQIVWPENYQPEESQFFVHNEIQINAPATAVWEILIDASQWESYYAGATKLVLENSTSGKLEANTIFKWKTMGLDFVSEIKEFDAPYRLAWESNKSSIQGYHAWLIIPNEMGYTLVTSEAQHGIMTLAQKVFVPNKLEGLHDEWLLAIKNLAEKQES